MKKIIRTNNLQKALEDYDALKGQAVSYVSVLPVSPNIRNSVYCKQTTTDIEDSLNITVESLIQDYAEETGTANHYVIPVTYTVEYLGIVVRAIEVSGDVAIMYEDTDFTTALAATFNLEDKYIFAVTSYVTEMAYYMGDVTNQTLHPVVSFGVIAEVNTKIDRVERELDAKIDSNYNTLDTKIDNSYNTLDNKIDNNYNTLDNKIDNSYNTLDNKIDNEISNLAVNFTTNNLVANVATVNNAVIGNAQVNNFDVSSIIANGSTGSDGQVLGKVNGNVEWFSPAAIDTNDFKVNYLTVNNGANVNGNNFKHKGFDVTSMTVISEADYNNLGWEYRNSALYMTTPNGNMYFHGIKYAATSMPKEYTAYVDLPLMANDMTTLTTSTLTFTSGAVTNSFVNGGAYNGIKERTPFFDGWNNSAPIGTQANTGSITTNAHELYITNAAAMYNHCTKLTDTFITNPSLIAGAPVGYDPLKYCKDMQLMFYTCMSFNQPITIPNSVTTLHSTFYWCNKFNQPITIPNGVADVSYMFMYAVKFNQPLIIPNSVTNMDSMLRGPSVGEAPIFGGSSSFNSPITIGTGVTNMDNAFAECRNLANSSVPIHISHEIALGNTSNYIYNMLVNGGCGLTIAPSRILNDF